MRSNANDNSQLLFITSTHSINPLDIGQKSLLDHVPIPIGYGHGFNFDNISLCDTQCHIRLNIDEKIIITAHSGRHLYVNNKSVERSILNKSDSFRIGFVRFQIHQNPDSHRLIYESIVSGSAFPIDAQPLLQLNYELKKSKEPDNKSDAYVALNLDSATHLTGISRYNYIYQYIDIITRLCTGRCYKLGPEKFIFAYSDVCLPDVIKNISGIHNQFETCYDIPIEFHSGITLIDYSQAFHDALRHAEDNLHRSYDSGNKIEYL
jgi:hypothetical protein